MNILVKENNPHQGTVTYNGKTWPCALGKTGLTEDKTEGDHASPIGLFPLRALYYRPDKLAKPNCALPLFEISENDGWCDAPEHTDYNKKVALPFADSHEILKREDDLYDLIVILGHNDNPPIPGKGSCIFMHVAKPEYLGTEGCVALKREHLLELLADISPETCLEISL